MRPDFDAVLIPHRSLGPRGFMIFMSAVAAVSFIAGVFFYSIGAWPVVGFFGLDALLIYGAFKLNYRSGRRQERVQIVGPDLIVRETLPSGRVRSAILKAYWVRVTLIPVSQERVRLVLRSHGHDHVIGRFLNDAEKRSFADALSKALSRCRTHATA
ncbi:MAG: DUF2244 domain-containing protein [Hyphomicrobiaceae bacterium]